MRIIINGNKVHYSFMNELTDILFENKIIIGKNVYFKNNVSLEKGIIIGNNVTICESTNILKNVRIGSKVFIGSHCQIKESVVIGNNINIANGSRLYSKCEILDNINLGFNSKIAHKTIPSHILFCSGDYNYSYYFDLVSNKWFVNCGNNVRSIEEWYEIFKKSTTNKYDKEYEILEIVLQKEFPN